MSRFGRARDSFRKAMLRPAEFSSPSAVPDTPSPRPRVSLHGTWERHVNGALYDAVTVPSSLRPLGYYHLKRQFVLARLQGGERAFVHFDSIHHHGRVFVNGEELGAMGPYVPYEFEMTRAAHEGGNTIDVAIADRTPEPGGTGKDEIELCLTPGWEASGGIVRDAYVEMRPAAFIENVALGYMLDPGYGRAACKARVFVSSASAGPARIETALLHGDTTVAQAGQNVSLPAGAHEVELTFELTAPLLWSPATPNLYGLRATLRTSGGEDQWSTRTGFRDVRIRGREFLLNGERLVLAGVCRHDMWKDQGFTLTAAQMDQDMRMIKAMGANFVRLAHYPHHRRIIELADALGLFVTEEPGHWNVDFHKMPRGRIDASLAIMERTIRRDWNSPSVFAWLLGNESNLKVDYLRECKALCNRLDPVGRPVSFAHIYNDSKKTFDAGGLDFYTAHMYGFDEAKFSKVAEQFGPDKPLVHTEWGWEDAGRGEIVYERSFDRLLDMVEEGRVAGHSFWSWQDIREYTRIDWPTQNGILLSGVVDEAREPRERLYVELSRLFQRKRHETPPARSRPDPVPLRFQSWSPKAIFEPVDVQKLSESDAARKSWSELETRIEKFWTELGVSGQWKRTGGRFLLWQGADVNVSGVPFRVPVAGDYARPLVVTPGSPEISVPLGLDCVRLHILGHVTLPGGYPATGKPGEVIASYTVALAGGKMREVPLRNGVEVARSNMIHEATRTNPIAAAAPRALIFTKDVVREHYQVLLYSLPVNGRVQSITLRLKAGADPLLVFAITAERV